MKVCPKYSKICLKWPLKKKIKIGFQDRLSLIEGQNYCRMHSAILLTFIKLPFAIKTFVLSIFEWLLKTGFNVYLNKTIFPAKEFNRYYISYTLLPFSTFGSIVFHYLQIPSEVSNLLL